ncbi:MAG: amidohydrolase family protein [Oscillospiraceae bacterium]|nr:amidohydrolase family protein [Oscillospiraceae bacterium]
MIIDFHTHLFPDELAQKALAHLVKNLQEYEPDCDPNAPYTDATVSGLISSQTAAGIDLSVVMPIATSTRYSETLNNFAAAVDRVKGLRSFGSIHPNCPQALSELERIHNLGLKGIKLHPEYQACYADSQETISVVKRAAELGLWVLFHAGADVGMPPPVHGSPRHFIRLREAVPDANIILAHMGAFRLWEQAAELYPGTGFFVDTSFSLEENPDKTDCFADIIRSLGTDHVLFGTDSPWADQTKALQTIKRFLSENGFSDEDTHAILSGNAEKILNDNCG